MLFNDPSEELRETAGYVFLEEELQVFRPVCPACSYRYVDDEELDILVDPAINRVHVAAITVCTRCGEMLYFMKGPRLVIVTPDCVAYVTRGTKGTWYEPVVQQAAARKRRWQNAKVV